MRFIDPDGRQVFVPFFGMNPVMMGGSSPLLGAADPIKLGGELPNRIIEVGGKSSDPVPAPTQSGGVKPNFQRINAGRQTEAEQLQRLGMDKNTESFTRIDPKTGKEGTTIPDGMKNGQTTEIKNVQRLTDSKQLRLQKEVSSGNGQLPRIIINESARISETVRNGGYDIETYNQNFVMPNDAIQSNKPQVVYPIVAEPKKEYVFY
jgi:hypothetical protein